VSVPAFAVDLDRIAEVCRRYGVARLEAFGFVSRGDDRPERDVDVLYERSGPSADGFYALVAHASPDRHEQPIGAFCRPVVAHPRSVAGALLILRRAN
jgi:hypothetical protein